MAYLWFAATGTIVGAGQWKISWRGQPDEGEEKRSSPCSRRSRWTLWTGPHFHIYTAWRSCSGRNDKHNPRPDVLIGNGLHTTSRALDGVRMSSSTKPTVWLTVCCVCRSRYAAQQSLIIVVPGSIQSLVTAITVSAVVSGTGTKKVLPDSRSSPPNTHCPFTAWPLLYCCRSHCKLKHTDTETYRREIHQTHVHESQEAWQNDIPPRLNMDGPCRHTP